MNIEAFNTDTLRKLVRNLQDENKKLKEKLDEANIPYEEINLFEQPINKSAEYDPDQGGRIIHPRDISQKIWQNVFSLCFGEEKMSMPKEQEMVAIFLNVITDGIVIYVLNNKKKKVYCDECSNRKWTKLDVKRSLHIC